jgi:predicted SnoaL-like aldol condensation-catalyzing enzyme
MISNQEEKIMFTPTNLFAAATAALILASATQSFAETGTRDLAIEEANRQLVIGFYSQVFNEHDLAGASEFVANDYVQHNPTVATGKEAFVEFAAGLLAANPDTHGRIVRSAAEGDLVWLHVHAGGNEDGTGGLAIIDIFRVEDGKITEHWDVLQPVPAEAANENTMF